MSYELKGSLMTTIFCRQRHMAGTRGIEVMYLLKNHPPAEVDQILAAPALLENFVLGPAHRSGRLQ
jgi:hypothetical protein